ncbi:MAG: SsrA-binding protein SmpB [Leptospiraceae bacterium]|nr:SsrA-binding protein SmpB [Leptospiraceae bacterium]
MEIAVNRKARFNYEIIEDFEAGIALTGTEVKSLRQKKVNISDGYVLIRGNRVQLINCRIEPYEQGNIMNHDPLRPRNLLLKQKEIDRMRGKMHERGYALLPLKMYFKGRYVKLLIGLGKGKKTHDKRSSIREKDIRRDTEREMKSYK